MCLDVLRAIEREPDAARALFDSWRTAARDFPVLLNALNALAGWLRGSPDDKPMLARRIAQQLVLTAQGVLLAQGAPSAVAAAFIDTRLGNDSASTGRVYGTLPATFDFAAMIDRAFRT